MAENKHPERPPDLTKKRRRIRVGDVVRIHPRECCLFNVRDGVASNFGGVTPDGVGRVMEISKRHVSHRYYVSDGGDENGKYLYVDGFFNHCELELMPDG